MKQHSILRIFLTAKFPDVFQEYILSGEILVKLPWTAWATPTRPTNQTSLTTFRASQKYHPCRWLLWCVGYSGTLVLWLLWYVGYSGAELRSGPAAALSRTTPDLPKTRPSFPPCSVILWCSDCALSFDDVLMRSLACCVMTCRNILLGEENHRSVIVITPTLHTNQDGLPIHLLMRLF